MEYHHHQFGQKEEEKERHQRKDIAVVTPLAQRLHVQHGIDQQPHYTHRDGPVQEAYDAAKRNGMVGERRVHTFIGVQVDEHQQCQENDEIAGGGCGHGSAKVDSR